MPFVRSITGMRVLSAIALFSVLAAATLVGAAEGERVGKRRLDDLVVMQGGKSKTIISKQSLDDYVWSPDDKTLAISKDGELVFYDLKAERAQSIALRKIDPGLDSHMARLVTWNPAGDTVACRIEFFGGRRAGGPKWIHR